MRRIDSTKGYSIDNCRWASAETQNTNRKTVKTVSVNGESMPFPEFFRKFSSGDVIYQTAFQRIFTCKWNPIHALSKGV